MRKVCHLTSVHQYNDVRIFVKECASLAKAGYDTYLVAMDCEDQELNGVKIISAGKRAGNRLIRMTKNVWQVYQKGLEIDAHIYHFHDPELIPAGLLLKRKGKKVIFDIHEDLPKQILSKPYINKHLRKLLADIIEKVESFAVKRLDVIITVTPHIKKRFRLFNSNIYEIKNYPVIRELSVIDHWENKKNEICYIGGVFEHRGIRELIKALEKCNVRMNLAGNFSPAKLEKEIKSYNSWNKVNYYGFANRTEVKEILRKSKAGIVTLHPVPNYLDALPVKMFEYMAAGLPVIASDFPYWRSLIEKHQCAIFVDPADPEAIAEAINYIIENEAEAKAMGARGRQAVDRDFNWEAEEKKLLDIYSSL